MLITSLNKIIALFLSGGAALAFAAVLHWPSLAEASFVRDAPASTGDRFLLGLLFVPAATLVGACVEGLSGVTLQRFAKSARKSDRIATFFLRCGEKRYWGRWLDRMDALVASREEWAWLATVPESERKWWLKETAVGMAIVLSDGDRSNWLIRHYSTFVLAANLALVVGSGTLYGALMPVISDLLGFEVDLILGGFLPTALFTGVGMISVWSLLSLATGRYLYCFALAARHVALSLTHSGSESSATGKVSGSVS